MAAAFDSNFSFNQQLWYYYTTNRGKIRSRYNDLTRKFLAYNDSEENPHAFLRKPQFEALEMYVFVKEFMNNKQVYEMFDDWRNRRDRFSDASYYAVDKGGQIRLFDAPTEKQTDTIFKQMKKYREDYPNYIYALTMGLGKTILMATCIFYEFLLAKKYPRDKRFCHNALVFAPDKTVLQSLREIMTFDKTKVVPPEYARVLDANIKFHFLDESGTILHTIDDSDFNIIISNTQKIIVKKKRKETTAAETLFSGSGSLLSAVYGTDSTDAEDDAWDDSTLMDNQRFKKLCRLPQLGVYVDPVSCRNMQGQESARSLGAVFSVFVELPQPNCQRLRIHQDKICLRLAQLDAGSRHTAIFLHLLTEKSARVHKKLLSFSSLHYSDYNHYNGKRQAPYNIQKWGDAVPISFRPMRQLMESNHISFYRLANEGIDAQTLQRIRHDKPVTTDTLGKICSIMKCQPGDLIEYIEDACEPDSAE